MGLKVIGAGFGRTGTKSLQLALEELGFGKCYHMEELFRNPEGVVHWESAYQEKETDWNALFQNYASAVDFPTSMYLAHVLQLLSSLRPKVVEQTHKRTPMRMLRKPWRWSLMWSTIQLYSKCRYQVQHTLRA